MATHVFNPRTLAWLAAGLWCIGAAATAGRAADAPTAAAPAGEKIESKRHGLTCVAPAGWKAHAEGVERDANTLFSLLAPDTGAEDVFLEIVSLEVMEGKVPAGMADDVALGKFVEAWTDEITRKFKGTVVESAPAKLGGAGARRITGLAKAGGRKGPTDGKFVGVLAVKNGRCYRLILSATPATFDAHRPAFDAVLGSFAWQK